MSKILIVSEALGEPNHKRGIFHFTRDLVRSLAKEGHDLTLLVETSPRYRKLKARQKQVGLFPEGTRLIELLALYRFLDEADAPEVPGRPAWKRRLAWYRGHLRRILSREFGEAMLRAAGLAPVRAKRIDNDIGSLAYVPRQLRHLELFRSFHLEPGFYGFQDVSALTLMPAPRIDARGYDVVVLDTPIRVRVRRDPGARVVGVIHDLLPLTDLKLTDMATRVFMSRVKSLLIEADELAFVSRFSLDVFRQLLPQFAHVPARVVYPRTTFTIAEPQDGAPLERPSFVVIVSDEPRKNLATVLRAFRGLPQADLVVIGKASPEILQGLPPNARYAGYVDEQEKAALLAGAHGLIMPSYAEGFGIPIIEALAANTPVVCSDIPVFREVAGDLAEYFDPFSDASLRGAVERVIAMQDALRQRIRVGRPMLVSRFDFAGQGRDLLSNLPDEVRGGAETPAEGDRDGWIRHEVTA